MKTRISLTIDEHLVKNVDSLVGVVYDSRSDAIESMLKKSITEKPAVILAGGNPDNLYIKEAKRYRPLLNIGGRTLIEDIIQKVSAAGYRRIFIVGSTQILAAIRQVLDKLNLNIEYIEETNHKGSAWTLKHIKDRVSGSFLFLPCDHFFNFDLLEIERIHRKNNSTATLAVYAGTNFEWSKSSIVEMKNDVITGYWEKVKKPSTHLVAVMTGILEPSVLLEKGNSLQEDIFPSLVKKRLLRGFIVNGDYVNVHSTEDVKKIMEVSK